MLINASNPGQLGNRLQKFAHLIAFSITNNQKVINLGFTEYADLFENTSQDILCRYPPKRSVLKFHFLRTSLSRFSRFLVRRKILEKFGGKKIEVVYAYPFTKKPKIEFRLDNPEFLASVNNKRIIFTWGYHFVDYVNLLKHSDRIREYFTPQSIHLANINALIEKARGTCEILVGVHIRHTDFKRYKDGKFYYDVDEYVDLMKKMEKLFPAKKVGFLVCSDELQDIKRFEPLKVTFGTNHIIEDMYSLARCDYIIGPWSTYSKWASFYGNVPIYNIDDVNLDFTLKDFKFFEDIVHRHMETAAIFPRPRS